jgi:hypothetical protein
MNQPLHEMPSKKSRTIMRISNRGRRRTTLILATLSAFTAHADDDCAGGDGWAATSDCKSYFLCQGGAPAAGVVYTCVENTLFDATMGVCLPAGSFVCPGAEQSDDDGAETQTASTVIDWSSNGVSPGQQLAAMTEAVDIAPVDSVTIAGGTKDSTNTTSTEAAEDSTNTTSAPVDSGMSATPVLQSSTAPTNFPTKLGPPMYYGDFRSSSCLSAAASNETLAAGLSPPDWLTEDLMYRSKEECCTDMFGWAPLENCLGDGWVETNYVKGTLSPTGSPTWSPTGFPSGMPSTTVAPSPVPTVVHSDVPSVPPSYAPTYMPSVAVTTLVPTPFVNEISVQAYDASTEEYNPESRPVTQSSSTSVDPNASFLVELLGWANSDSYVENTSPTHRPTQKPNQDSFAISEVILPIAEDATVSLTRPDLNFGANSALAVDGGTSSSDIEQDDGLGERFDSLLKFDTGMIDNSRPLESAVLRIYALSDCPSGGTFVTTTDSSWDQESVTWDNSPVADGYEIGTVASVQGKTWYELDMMPALGWNDSISAFSSGQNVISIRISSSTNGRCMYSSMEGGQAKAPYMSVRYGQSNAIQEMSTVLVEPPVTGQFLLLRSTGDSSLDASNPGARLGYEPTLKVAFDMSSRGISDVVIRFDLAELGGVVPVSAVLSLYAEMDCPSAGTITTTEGDSLWSEGNVSWLTAPAYQRNVEGGGFNVGTFGQVSSNKWYGFDVVNAVKQASTEGKSVVTFRISTATDGECRYSSRESGRDPKLMVAF